MEKISIRKILQILYYIQSHSRNERNKYAYMYLLKMMYFADRHHLRHYGLTISSDKYKAMQYGPVESGTWDIIKKKMPKNANSAELELLHGNITDIDEYDVTIEQQAEDELSESCKNSLDFSLKHFAKFNQFELSNISHVYPEWSKHKEKIMREKRYCNISLADFFSDPEDISYLLQKGISKDPFEENDKNFLHLLKEGFCEVTC